MSAPDPRNVTLPQVLALMAIWTAVIYGLSNAKPRADVEHIALKAKASLPACARRG
jgi:hypothetical protein